MREPVEKKKWKRRGKKQNNDVILTTGRELALQTLKFAKELGKYTDLRMCMFVGGDHIEEQFAAVATNPEIIVATPGRLMHLILEMNLELRAVECVVLDEADRLFELGFAEQPPEILRKLPPTRKTSLFSATLPKLLVDLQEREDKDARLIHIMHNHIPKDSLTLIFVATKYHVEYVHELLKRARIPNNYIYGALDQSTLFHHLNFFRNGIVKVLVVTTSPLSRESCESGADLEAFALISSDEVPYLIDFQIWTGRPLVLGSDDGSVGGSCGYTSEIVVGRIPEGKVGVASLVWQ
ncbi:P-loop containing nucleoside triphosphate hydrolase protein [Cladochytrium replicatum]|nr:P-loop containing nucleoside triphosphate hydrolase protein [Cladochytrium replicatum]